MLDDSNHTEAGYYSDTNQLQADVQPLHGGVAEEQAALVLFQAPGALLLKSATTNVSPLDTVHLSLFFNCKMSEHLSPGTAATAPDGFQPSQCLREVRVDGRQSEAAQALQLPRRVSVEALCVVVEQSKGQQGY